MDNFKILIYEKHIVKEKEKTVKDLCNFLDVNHELYPSHEIDLGKYHNRGLEYRFDQEGVFVYDKDKINQFLVVTQEQLQDLKKIYYEDFKNLQKLLDINLSVFWDFK